MTDLNIGRIIHDRRIELRMTMKELSEKVGVAEGTISRWESGEIKNMRRDAVAALSKALGIPPQILMGWDDSDNPNQIDPETMQLAAMLKDKPGLVRVARLGKNLSEDDLKQVAQYTEFLAAKNEGAKLNDVDDDL